MSRDSRQSKPDWLDLTDSEPAGDAPPLAGINLLSLLLEQKPRTDLFKIAAADENKDKEKTQQTPRMTKPDFAPELDIGKPVSAKGNDSRDGVRDRINAPEPTLSSPNWSRPILTDKLLEAFGKPRIVEVSGNYRQTLEQMKHALAGIPDEQRVAFVLRNDYQDSDVAPDSKRTDYRIVIDKAGNLKKNAARLWLGDANLEQYEFLLDFSVLPEVKAIKLHSLSIGNTDENIQKLRGRGLARDTFSALSQLLGRECAGYSVRAVAIEETMGDPRGGAMPKLLREFFNARKVPPAEYQKLPAMPYVDPVDGDSVYVGTVKEASQVPQRPSVSGPGVRTSLETNLTEIARMIGTCATGSSWSELTKMGAQVADAARARQQAKDLTDRCRHDIQKTLGYHVNDQQWQDVRGMDALLKERPDLLRQYRAASAATNEADIKQTRLNDALGKTHAPIIELQNRLNPIMQKAGLPSARFTVGTDFNDQAHYKLGTGWISLDARTLTHGCLPGLTEAVSHELKHLEQDALIIRVFAAEQRDKKNGAPLDESDYQKIRERYANSPDHPTEPGLGHELSDAWLRKVLQSNSSPVSSFERHRAYSLIESLGRADSVGRERERLRTESRNCSDAIELLKGPNGGTKMIDELASATKRQAILGSTEVPEYLSYLLRLRSDIASGRLPAAAWDERRLEVREYLQQLLEGRILSLCNARRELYLGQYHERESHDTGAKARAVAAGDSAPMPSPAGAEVSSPGKPATFGGESSEAARTEFFERPRFNAEIAKIFHDIAQKPDISPTLKEILTKRSAFLADEDLAIRRGSLYGEVALMRMRAQRASNQAEKAEMLGAAQELARQFGLPHEYVANIGADGKEEAREVREGKYERGPLSSAAKSDRFQIGDRVRWTESVALSQYVASGRIAGRHGNKILVHRTGFGKDFAAESFRAPIDSLTQIQIAGSPLYLKGNKIYELLKTDAPGPDGKRNGIFLQCHDFTLLDRSEIRAHSPYATPDLIAKFTKAFERFQKKGLPATTENIQTQLLKPMVESGLGDNDGAADRIKVQEGTEQMAKLVFVHSPSKTEFVPLYRNDSHWITADGKQFPIGQSQACLKLPKSMLREAVSSDVSTRRAAEAMIFANLASGLTTIDQINFRALRAIDSGTVPTRPMSAEAVRSAIENVAAKDAVEADFFAMKAIGSFDGVAEKIPAKSFVVSVSRETVRPVYENVGLTVVNGKILVLLRTNTGLEQQKQLRDCDLPVDDLLKQFDERISDAKKITDARERDNAVQRVEAQKKAYLENKQFRLAYHRQCEAKFNGSRSRLAVAGLPGAVLSGLIIANYLLDQGAPEQKDEAPKVIEPPPDSRDIRVPPVYRPQRKMP